MITLWLGGALVLSLAAMVVIVTPLEMRRRTEIRQGILPKSTPRIAFHATSGQPHLDVGYIWSRDFLRSPYVTPLKAWLLRLSMIVFALAFVTVFVGSLFGILAP